MQIPMRYFLFSGRSQRHETAFCSTLRGEGNLKQRRGEGEGFDLEREFLQERDCGELIKEGCFFGERKMEEV